MPCDTGGLAACHYWRTHGYSPGEPDHPHDRFAWNVYWQMQQLGWEAVNTLRKLAQLSEYEADWLLTRLLVLHEAARVQQQERQDHY